MIHELKIKNEYLLAVIDGSKTFELRKDDRGYKVGDYLQLQSYRITKSYRITNIVIIDKRITDVIPTDLENKLLLITCYPFDAIKAGGPLRYIVVAKSEYTNILS